MCIYNHHAVFDGWSLSIVIRDFFRAYSQGFGLDEGVVRKRICFKTFIDYYRKLPLQPQRQFWQDNLEGVLPCLLQEIDFTTDREEDGSSRKLSFALDPSLINDVKRLAGESTATMSSVLFSAWAKNIAGVYRSGRYCVRTTLSIRDERVIDIDNSVGLYMNTVPVRLKSEDCTTIPPGYYGNERCHPGHAEKRFAATGRNRKNKNCTRRTAFQHLVCCGKLSSRNINKGRRFLRIADIVYQEQNNFDLSVIVQCGSLLQVTILYRSILFSNKYIECLAAAYQHILEAFVDPDQQLHSMGILSSRDSR